MKNYFKSPESLKSRKSNAFTLFKFQEPTIEFCLTLIKETTKNMVIERTNDEVIIRLPASINTEGLQELVDYLIYNEVTINSVATQEDVDALAKEVKSGWWAKNKARLTK